MSIYRRLNRRGPPSAPSAGSDDRRSVCRYTVVKDDCWLGWWKGTEFQSVAAKIADISLRGAMLTVPELPLAEQAVWFCPPNLCATSPSEWLEAKVIEARKRFLGPRVVRIILRKPFPYEIFKAVVYGPDAVGGVFQPQAWLSRPPVDEGAEEW